MLFTGVWLIATYLFGLYIAHFASYNSTYGTLGGVVILLVWFYLTAFILLVGAELNAVLEKRAANAAASAASEHFRVSIPATVAAQRFRYLRPPLSIPIDLST